MTDTSTLEVICASNGEEVFVRDTTDKTLQMTFDAWWSEMEVVTKKPVYWKGQKTAKAWEFYKQCALTENGSPSIVCIVCHKLLSHPAMTGTSAMSKHLTAREHVAKLNDLASSTGGGLLGKHADQQVLAMLKTKGSHGVLIVSSDKPLLFELHCSRQNGCHIFSFGS